jgi:collagenase-like PrtC family protease
MKKIELLLPAGTEESLKAAVENGADAVYFGIDRFNARRRATNFELNKIKSIIDYCHENGVRAYCTLNILIKNEEIKEFFETIKTLYLAGIDAVIVQHLSFIPIIKQNFPDLEVHLSTQATITNSYFQYLIKQADRIVLPRELSEEEITSFIKKTKLPVEVFVQGAMCFSYSGKCLFSSFLGGRSGNRGLCAQPCRKKYNRSYLLSMKDLCLVKKIPELIKSGIVSLKIEGRLRSPKYVAAAAKLYRKAIDSHYEKNFTIDSELFKEMKLAFNREFTWGYYANLKNIISPEKPMGRGLYLGEINKRGLIKLEEDLQLGDGLGIWLRNKVDGAVLKKMELNKQEVQEAKKGDLVKPHIRAPPGTRIYKTSSVTPTKEITFTKKPIIKIKERKTTKLTLPETKEQPSTDELLVKVYTKKDANLALKYTDKVFYNIFSKDFTNKFSAFVPRILTDQDIEEALQLIKQHKPRNILIGDLGLYTKINKKEFNVYIDYSNNIFNEFDLDFFPDTTPIISPELSFKELQELKNKHFSVLVHGRVILMNTMYDQLPEKLKDEKKYIFPVRKEHTYHQILNSKTLGLFEKIKELKKAGMNSFFLDLEKNTEETLNTYQQILKGKKPEINKWNFTKGHWDKGVE